VKNAKTGKQKGEGQVMLVLRQVTTRMRGQDGMTEKEEDERCRVWTTVPWESRGAKGHVWVVSLTGKQGEESERMIGWQGKQVSG
jgi:hypothetical protein